MKKSVISFLSVAAIPCLMLRSLQNTSAIAKDNNTTAFELSLYIDEEFSKSTKNLKLMTAFLISS